MLADRGIKATFFVVGEQLSRPDARTLTERAEADGHWIGNHTMTHSVQFGDHDDPELAAREIGAAEDVIGPLAHPDKLFRPYVGGGVLGRRVFSTAAIDYL